MEAKGYHYTNDRSNPISYIRSQEQMVCESFAATILLDLTAYTLSLLSIGMEFSSIPQAREQEVKVATVRLLQDQIKECYRREGANHYQNCRDLTQKYRAMVKVSMSSYRSRNCAFSRGICRLLLRIVSYHSLLYHITLPFPPFSDPFILQDPYFNWYKPARALEE